jgi:isopenicillin N synthase-like dioxygenase
LIRRRFQHGGARYGSALRPIEPEWRRPGDHVGGDHVYGDPVTGLVVPIVDVDPWRSGDRVARQAVADEVDAALREIGFMQLVGHAIPDRVVADMVDTSGAFFDLPLDRKLAVRPDDLTVNRGYAASGTEALSYSIGDATPPDLFEAFNMGEDVVDEVDPFYAAERHRMFAPNIWPDELPELRSALVSYFAEARRVALELTDVFAAALGLPDRWFRPFVSRSTTTMRTINYERRHGDPEPAPGQQRMGAHTDYGVVTVLWADRTPGLQILGHDGAWHDVAPESGALLVNIGDLTAEWTNDRWRSTLHRVVPLVGGGPTRRRSTAFFFDADWDATVECVPTCTDADHPPKYPPVLAGEHLMANLMAKLMGPRTLRPSAATDTAAGRHGR